jgi:hypothetical protein
MTMLTIAALALSVALLAMLCVGDPKRRRTAGLRDDATGRGMRRLLAVGSVLPGVALALAGDAAAFMIWIGGYAVFGWWFANLFCARKAAPARRR